jgi:hypothetical protein
MVGRKNARRELNRLLTNRQGTAEIVGSVMFLLILLFFFTNVYMWHDSATREMNNVLSAKMNSLVKIEWDNGNLTVTNTGGVDAYLSRLWIIDDQGHHYIDLEVGQGTRVPAGDTINLPIQYVAVGVVIFKVLTTRGNSAACKYIP